MKTAISISDELFEGAERLARDTNRSRSRVYGDALREYLTRHSPDTITETMNQALKEIGDETDPFVASASRRTLEKAEW